MPMRAYRASTAYAGAHVKDNMWLWIAVSAVLTGVLAAVYWMSRGSLWANLLTLTGMVCGVLVMLQSQVGFVSPYVVDDDEDDAEVVTPPLASVPLS